MMFFTDTKAWERYAAEMDVVRGMAFNLLDGSNTHLEYSKKLLAQVCDEAAKLGKLTGKEMENLVKARKLLNHEL